GCRNTRCYQPTMFYHGEGGKEMSKAHQNILPFSIDRIENAAIAVGQRADTRNETLQAGAESLQRIGGSLRRTTPTSDNHRTSGEKLGIPFWFALCWAEC